MRVVGVSLRGRVSVLSYALIVEGALIDPLAKRVDFVVGEGGSKSRHAYSDGRIVRGDFQIDQALRRAARDDEGQVGILHTWLADPLRGRWSVGEVQIDSGRSAGVVAPGAVRLQYGCDVPGKRHQGGGVLIGVRRLRRAPERINATGYCAGCNECVRSGL